MSGDNQGEAVNLNEEIQASKDTITSGILSESEKEAVVDSALQRDDISETIPSISDIVAENPQVGELEAFDDDIETVIEKKLKPVEEKGLDVDSELDFELKWEDDDLPKMETDAVPVENVSEQGLVTSEEDMLDATTSSVNLDKDIASIDVNDGKIEDVQLQSAEDELLGDEALSNDDLSKIETEPTVLGKVDEEIADTTTLEDNAVEADDILDEDISNTGIISDVELQQTEDELLEDVMHEVSAVNKVKLISQVSPVESETNSLDEQLVYSDVEAPEIEDKDLMEELDAHISEATNDVKIVELEPETTVLPKSDSDEVTAMDIDDSTVLPVIEAVKSSPNDTIVSEDLNTSVYEVNSGHKLAKPDAMIEIPTQELIEGLDDSGELSDDVDQYDEDVLLEGGTDVPTDVIEVAEIVEGNTDEAQIVNIEPIIEEPDSVAAVDKEENKANFSEIKELSLEAVKGKVAAEEDSNDKTIAEEVESSTDVTSTKLGEPVVSISEINDDNNSTDKPTDKTKLNDNKIQNKDVTVSTDNHADVILDAKHVETEKAKITGKTESIIDTEPKLDVDMEEATPEKTLESATTTEVKDIQSTAKLERKTNPVDDPQPSTSKLTHHEYSDEDQEVTDSLGLLAESSRVMGEDDDHENEQDDEDDEDDFDQDDESNQMTAEHSEDSNATESNQITAEQSEDSNAPECVQVSAEQSEDSNTDVMKSALQETVDAVETTSAMEVEESTDAEKEIEAEKVAQDEPVDTVAQAEESMEAPGSEVEKAVETLQADKTPEDSPETVVEPSPSVDVEIEDTSTAKTEECSKLRSLLTSDTPIKKAEAEKLAPSKMKKLEVAKPRNEINIVELEESSSEDDIQEVNRTPSEPRQPSPVRAESSNAVESKTASASPTAERDPSCEPEKATEGSSPAEKNKASKFNLEIFNLDSDDEEKETAETPHHQQTAPTAEKEREPKQCINALCTSDSAVPLEPADASTAAFYASNQRRGMVCATCADAALTRTQSLIEGIKDFTPLLSLHMGHSREELVEISDSDSEDELGAERDADKLIGKAGAKFLEEHLATMFNETWCKYDMDARLQTAENELNLDVMRLEKECNEINSMLNECQVATDKLRNELYDSFAGNRKELPAILIYDTPPNTWSGLEENILAQENKETRSKRRASTNPEPPAKRPAIPLGYTPLESDTSIVAQNEPKPAGTAVDTQNDDDNADISVVKLSAESAPAGLPPPGAASRAALRAHMPVYAMRNAFGSWMRARIVDVQPRSPSQGFTMCRVKFEHKARNAFKLLPARCLAYEQPSEVRMTIGTRIIALFKDTMNTKRESFYSGIVAEIPNPVNNYRYLVFFDDGYAQYVTHGATRLVCEFAPLVWDEVHPFSRQFVRDYLRAYPERPMVRAHKGQSLKTEWNGKWWVTRVLQVDASLVQVRFEEDERTEWIYRGSTRLAPLFLELQAAGRQRTRPLTRAQPGRRFNMPYVEYTRSDETPAPPAPTPAQIEQDIRRQRAVAKKSTAMTQHPAAPAISDGVTSRVVFYTPKNAIKPHKMVPHTCSPRCRRTDVLGLKELRTYNPLTKPLLSGWERQLVKYRFTKAIMYRAPCGRRIRDMKELHQYLRAINSDMGVDLFDFGVSTHCLAEFVLTKCLISKKDLSHGKENVPVPCVNYYDDSLPEFCSYNTERTPTAGVPLNLDPEFLCGCDCTDDCEDKSKCACWKMTLEGARTIGLDTDEVGYVYKRLPEPLPSGIYECNSRCKCKQTCLNRVAQHPLQLKLQVFKTMNRGWGIRALNDVPKGSFLCVYAGNLLTDATANLDGLNEGDEYLAELDYIEVVEQMKEGFEEDIPEADKEIGKQKDTKEQEEESSPSSSSEEEETPGKDADDDFKPALPERITRSETNEFSKRLRKREKKSNKKEKEDAEKAKEEDSTITISDDEEVREPARFSARAEMGGNEFVSKYKSVRAHFGKDEACYIMDAKVQGNIGRYLNHSCTPNVFVQNVFVDTHDPRFPWVAFFALAHIRAGTELTWNYNYDVGSVPGKVLYCHCAAPNCRGRLL